MAYTFTDRKGGVGSPNRGVFVQPFPATGEKHQVPKTSLDFHPVWAPGGRGLLYIPSVARLTVSVPITPRPAIAFGTPVELRRGPQPGLLADDLRGYDLLPDGRFISLSSAGEGAAAVPSNEIRVVLNWTEELKAKVPTGKR